jgi:hypothetical protein
MGEKVDKVKKHFVDNKKFYIGVGVGAAVATTVTVLIMNGRVPTEEGSIKIINKIVGDHNSITTYLVRRGHPGFLIKCVETGEVFASQNRAAQVMGVSAQAIARHLKGENPHAGGFTFENLGEAVA